MSWQVFPFIIRISGFIRLSRTGLTLASENRIIGLGVIVTKKRPARKRVESPFAKNLKAILAERGLSQTAAASIAGVSPTVLNDWLHSTSVPNNLLAIQRLCRAINCDFEFLLTGSQTKLNLKEIALTELFESEADLSFSGIFQIEAKRLRVRKG